MRRTRRLDGLGLVARRRDDLRQQRVDGQVLYHRALYAYPAVAKQDLLSMYLIASFTAAWAWVRVYRA